VPTPLHCPSCARPVAWYVDRIGYVHSYCPEAERLSQLALGPCKPVVWAVTAIDQQELPLPSPRRRPGRRTGTHPQRRPKQPAPMPTPTRAQRMEGLRRYYLRKHGRAA
jgi:hypothetical protein